MKKLILILIILSMVLTSGCWDMVEINERLFPYSVAVDINEKDEGLDKYAITISYLNINAIGKNSTQEERVFIVSVTGSSIFEAVKKLSTHIPYPFHFKHLRVIVLGQELAKDGHLVRQIIDGLSRDYIINKKIQIIVADEKGKEVLETVPRSHKQEEIEGTLYSMLRDDKTAVRYSPKALTDFIQDMDKKGSSIVPRVCVEDSYIKMYGGAIVKDYSLVGKINEFENRAIAFMNGLVGTELIDVPYDDAVISYSVTDQSSKKKLIKEDGKLKFKVDIKIFGSLQSYVMSKDSQKYSIRIANNMDRKINNLLEKEIKEIMAIMQKTYKADVIGIKENIKKYHPKIWKEVEEDWDTIFQEIEIEINVDSTIRRRGLTQ